MNSSSKGVLSKLHRIYPQHTGQAALPRQAGIHYFSTIAL